MKAAFRSKYGAADVLSIQEIATPVPTGKEVLVRVYAASVNRTDNHVLTGKPFIMRLFTGLFKPKRAVTGTDFAGQIEAIGTEVSHFKPGDKVMGFGGVFGIGSHAQYVSFPENARIVKMPSNINYTEAAACIEGAYYAATGILQFQPRAGQKAMVYGATGAIGSAYMQFLKYCKVAVTAVCGGENSALVKGWGADRVIDYKTEDFTKDEERYDFIFDAVGKTTFLQCKPLLTKNGIYAPAGGFANLFWVLVTPLTGGKKVMFPTDNKANLSFIKGLIENENFKPVIDRIYPIEKIGEAFAYVATGQKIGNVIITIDQPGG